MNFKIELTNKIIEMGFSQVNFLKDNDTEGTIIIAAFPYNTRSLTQNKDKKIGVKVSPFAQKNHYKEAVNRLKKISLYIREEKSLTKKEIRIFCNSQLEEKKFAALSGLGFYGRNSLIITKQYGSRVILAGMTIPVKLEIDEMIKGASTPGANCGNCHACMINCPTSAIEAGGHINRDKCLQSLTTDERVLPPEIMEKWGNRLYGCSICQDCCPFNSNIDETRNLEITGNLGENIPFKSILEADDEELKSLFRGTALSMSWIKYDLLRRNAIISAVSENRKDLIPIIEKYTSHDQISYGAKWALTKLRKRS